MSERIRRHIRQNVVGYVALFLVISGGTAYATHPGGADTIDSADIINNSVKAADVRNDSLSGGGLVAADLRPDSVGSSEATDNSLTGADIDESMLSGLQRTGASGLSTGGGGTVTTEEGSVQFPVAGGTFTYFCFGTNAGEAWSGPQAEVWRDQGDANPSHFNSTGFEGAIGTNGGDRISYVITTADLVSELELSSHSTATECHYAYTLSEYER